MNDSGVTFLVDPTVRCNHSLSCSMSTHSVCCVSCDGLFVSLWCHVIAFISFLLIKWLIYSAGVKTVKLLVRLLTKAAVSFQHTATRWGEFMSFRCFYLWHAVASRNTQVYKNISHNDPEHDVSMTHPPHSSWPAAVFLKERTVYVQHLNNNNTLETVWKHKLQSAENVTFCKQLLLILLIPKILYSIVFGK